MSAARDSLLQDVPTAKFYGPSGRITRIYGGPLGFGDSPEDSAARFVRRHAAVLGTRADDLEPRTARPGAQHTIPLMYDPVENRYLLTLVLYSQHRGGVPVYGGDLKILIRNEPGFSIVYVVNGLQKLGAFRPDLSTPRGESAPRAAVLARYPSLTRFSKPELAIWAGTSGEDVPPTLAHSFMASKPSGAEPRKFLASIETGEIVHMIDGTQHLDLTGTVSALVTTGPTSDVCGPEAPVALPNAFVEIVPTGESAYADAAGNFVIPDLGTGTVTVKSSLQSPWVTVNNLVGFPEDPDPDSAFPNSFLEEQTLLPGPINFVHNSQNNSELYRAEVNAYYARNIVHDFVKHYSPTFPNIDDMLRIHVNIDNGTDSCPGAAGYIWLNKTIELCAACTDPQTCSALFANEAWSSVV